MAVIFEAKHIVKEFNGVPALSNGNLVCRSGRITGLLGANGSGKSTISKCITGVYRKNSGTMTYMGQEVDFKSPMEAKKAGIAMAFQNLSLLPELTVWQNVVMGFETKKGLFLDDKAAKATAKRVLDEFIPGFDYHRTVAELNPSEMQIVEIVKAISQQPKMLILDEPTAALEQSEVKSLFKYMRLLAQRGVGMLFTSHRMWEVMEICNDVIVFKNGQVVGSIDFDQEAKNSDTIIQMITGEKKIVSKLKIYKPIPEDNFIEIENLNYNKILENITMNIKKGEIVGVGGLSGQGQEELLLAVAGNYADIKSDIKVNGQRERLNSPNKAIEKGILLIPGDRQRQGLMMDKSIFENFILPKVALKKEPFIIPKNRYMEECVETNRILSTKSDSTSSLVSSLSGGNAQKIVMAKWLNVDMSLLILSDPAKGVDVGAKKDLYDFVQKLVNERGISVLLYASDNQELIDNCDRVLVMHDGRIVGELKEKEITEEALVELSMEGSVAKREARDNG